MSNYKEMLEAISERIYDHANDIYDFIENDSIDLRDAVLDQSSKDILESIAYLLIVDDDVTCLDYADGALKYLGLLDAEGNLIK